MTRPFRSLAVALLFSAQAVAAPAPQADREIRQLIDFVAHSNCSFIRNGDAHPSAAAADHLAMKYSKARNKLTTPEQFIEHIATRSYFSGREYRVQCPGAAGQASGAWLQNALREQRSASSIAASRPPSPGAPARDWPQRAQTRPD